MSTLTPEQRAAMNAAREKAEDAWLGRGITLTEHIWIAACRYQHERTREAAAKVADGMVPSEPSPIGPLHGAGMALAAEHIADTIRALTLAEC